MDDAASPEWKYHDGIKRYFRDSMDQEGVQWRIWDNENGARFKYHESFKRYFRDFLDEEGKNWRQWDTDQGPLIQLPTPSVTLPTQSASLPVPSAPSTVTQVNDLNTPEWKYHGTYKRYFKDFADANGKHYRQWDDEDGPVVPMAAPAVSSAVAQTHDSSESAWKFHPTYKRQYKDFIRDDGEKWRRWDHDNGPLSRLGAASAGQQSSAQSLSSSRVGSGGTTPTQPLSINRQRPMSSLDTVIRTPPNRSTSTSTATISPESEQSMRRTRTASLSTRATDLSSSPEPQATMKATANNQLSNTYPAATSTTGSPESKYAAGAGVLIGEGSRDEQHYGPQMRSSRGGSLKSSFSSRPRPSLPTRFSGTSHQGPKPTASRSRKSKPANQSVSSIPSRRDGDDEDQLNMQFQNLKVETPQEEILSGLTSDPYTPLDYSHPDANLMVPMDNTTRAPDRIRGVDMTNMLDRSYQVQRDPGTFFTKGKVFALVWHEGMGGSAADRSDLSRGPAYTKFGEEVYSSIRRMVVVRTFNGCSWSLPILTYRERGTTKPGLDPSTHAIVFMTGTEPTLLRNETGITKESLQIDPYTPDRKLQPASRINFAKIYTVEHNVRVKPIGQLDSSRV